MGNMHLLKEMVEPTAGVGFPCLFFRLLEVLYFAVLGLHGVTRKQLLPCPPGIFCFLVGLAAVMLVSMLAVVTASR